MSENNTILNGKPHVVTEALIKASWGGEPNGKRFRCHLCGHKFMVGDIARFYVSRVNGNFFSCQSCDGLDVLDRWGAANEEAKRRFWWMIRPR